MRLDPFTNSSATVLHRGIYANASHKYMVAIKAKFRKFTLEIKLF